MQKICSLCKPLHKYARYARKALLLKFLCYIMFNITCNIMQYVQYWQY